MKRISEINIPTTPATPMPQTKRPADRDEIQTNIWLRKQNHALIKTLVTNSGKIETLHKMIIEQQRQILALSAKLGAVLALVERRKN